METLGEVGWRYRPVYLGRLLVVLDELCMPYFIFQRPALRNAEFFFILYAQVTMSRFQSSKNTCLKASAINCNTSLGFQQLFGRFCVSRFLGRKNRFALPLLNNPSVNGDVMAITCSMQSEPYSSALGPCNVIVLLH
jgi:hypothetical protein